MNEPELRKLLPALSQHDFASQLRDHVYARSAAAFAAGDAARDAIQDEKALRRRQRWMRRRFLESLGGLPDENSPLKAVTTGTIEEKDLRIEKIVFQSRPGVYVTANLYLPAGVRPPGGAVLFLCGHHHQSKQVPEYQIVCRTLARAGLIVLAQDPTGQGERLNYYDPAVGHATVPGCIHDHDCAGSQCFMVRRGLASYFLHDAMRGIDYLLSRPEVDSGRIGVTGNSGGGTQTSMMMLADPRIAAAAPCTFIMNRENFQQTGMAQDSEQIWPGLTALGIDHEDILLVMAPRPVRVLAVTYDFFPIEGTRRTVRRCRRFWAMLGQVRGLDLVEDRSTHSYTRRLARAAAEFFAWNLNGTRIKVDNEDLEALDPPLLHATRAGQVRAEYADARAIFDENQIQLKHATARRRSLSDGECRNRATAWLRKKVSGERKRTPPNLRVRATSPYNQFTLQMGMWWSQPTIMNCGVLLRESRLAGRGLPVAIAVFEEGIPELHAHMDWVARTCAKGRAVLALDVTATGFLLPHPLIPAYSARELYGPLHKLSDDLFWLNDSLAAIRIWDILRAVDMLAEWPGVDCRNPEFYGRGRAGGLLWLAALLDARIRRIDAPDGADALTRWVKTRRYDTLETPGYIIPGLLEMMDMDDVERWVRGSAKHAQDISRKA